MHRPGEGPGPGGDGRPVAGRARSQLGVGLRRQLGLQLAGLPGPLRVRDVVLGLRRGGSRECGLPLGDEVVDPGLGGARLLRQLLHRKEVPLGLLVGRGDVVADPLEVLGAGTVGLPSGLQVGEQRALRGHHGLDRDDALGEVRRGLRLEQHRGIAERAATLVDGAGQPAEPGLLLGDLGRGLLGLLGAEHQLHLGPATACCGLGLAALGGGQQLLGALGGGAGARQRPVGEAEVGSRADHLLATTRPARSGPRRARRPARSGR